MNSNEKNATKVREIYAAWGRGELATVLEAIHVDCVWELGRTTSAVPWLAPRRGRAGAEEAFRIMSASLDFTRFEVIAIMSEGPWVVALCEVGCNVKSTGRAIHEVCEPHVWKLDDSGRVVAFRHAADTLMQVAAL